jgi:peptidoglycan/xylan/chitin deacetylase (PgdA/CDA1 family)
MMRAIRFNGVLIVAACAALWLSSCNTDSSVNENVPPPTDVGGTTYDALMAEIDASWQGLGYTEKPSKYIAISFDDGPAGAAAGEKPGTDELLAVLKAKQVRATFFLIGANIRSKTSYAKAIFDAGHELANHSDGYAGLGGSTAEDTIKASLEKASAAVKGITGKDPVFFRAPNVAYGDNLSKVCADMGLALIGVSCWSNDYQSGITVEAITQNVLSNPQPWDIINCHEPNTAPNTVAALPAMIEGLRARGYWVTSVGELAVLKGKTLEGGVRYDHLR